MNREIRLINNDIHTITFSNEDISNHFEDARNCTREILQQTNHDKLYDRYITPSDKVILDIGANIGLFAIHASPYAEKIYCVEPTPNHVKILKNITDVFPNIEIIEAALSNKSGVVKFYSSNTNTTTNSLFDAGGDSFEVKCYSLPDLINTLGLDIVDFCKIDIEGSEIVALNEDIISAISGNIKKLFIEFHHVNQQSYSVHREYYSKIFKKYGYSVETFSVDGLYCQKEIQ